jgi:hypothetical protein
VSANPIQEQGDVEQLAAVVRDEIQQARTAWRNALRHAMAAGDALNAVQLKVAERGINWKKWLRENCFVSDRTGQLYQQLANHRDQIEAELQNRGELSLRSARQLISKAKAQDEDDDRAGAPENEGETENPPESVKPETLIDHWRRSPAELTDLLDQVGVDGILGAMSAEFRRQLRARLPKRKSNKPFKHTLNLEANSVHGRGTHSRQ